VANACRRVWFQRGSQMSQGYCWDTHGPRGFPLISSSGSQHTDSWNLY